MQTRHIPYRPTTMITRRDPITSAVIVGASTCLLDLSYPQRSLRGAFVPGLESVNQHLNRFV
jgi:hypothetical protein